MRCPACGARNSDGAAWCTQCFADLRAPAGPPPGPADPPPTGADGPRTGEPPGVPGATPRADAAARDVRTVGGEVEWRCRRCEAWTPLEHPRCGVCDAPREGFGETTTPSPVAASARDRLTLASILLPGLGHLLARRVGTGVTRLVLGLSWLVGSVAVARAAGLLAAAPLLLGALVVWVGSVHDVRALVAGRPELLRPRVLTWLTVGVIAALLVIVTVLATLARSMG